MNNKRKSAWFCFVTYQTASWLAWVATLLKLTLLALESLTNFYLVVLGPVVQKLNSANHRLNHYPVIRKTDCTIHWIEIYIHWIALSTF